MQLDWLKEKLYTSIKSRAGIRLIYFLSAISNIDTFAKIYHFFDKVGIIRNSLQYHFSGFLLTRTLWQITHKLNVSLSPLGLLQVVSDLPDFTYQ